MNGLNQTQISRQDYVDNKIHNLIKDLAPKKSSIDWDIEMIGEVRDILEFWICEQLRLMKPVDFYPHYEENES